MTLTLDPDLWRSASHRNQIQHLTAPFAAGAANTPVAISNAGVIDVITFPRELLREPLLIISLKRAINSQRLRVSARLSGSSRDEPALEFVPFSELGATLPLYRPPVDLDTQTAYGFRLTLSLTEFANSQDLTGTVVPRNNIGQYLEAYLLQGLMGRMLYLMGAEKQRIRRQGREIVAMRSLDLARDNALDRKGSDLGVPRFIDNLRFREPQQEEAAAIFGSFTFGSLPFGEGRRGEIITELRREPDDEYRRRLAIYYPFLQPNYRSTLNALNGPGLETGPNQGLLSQLGVDQRFNINEESNKLAIAIHLVAVGDITLRTRFLDYIRNTYLILPNQNATTNAVHLNRPLPQIKKQQIENLRTRLSTAFDFGANAAIAPALATALDLVGRCRQALGITTPWQVFRTQDSQTQDNGGSSRYELGLGIEVPLPTDAELESLRQRANEYADDPFRPPAENEAENEIERLIQAMSSQPPSDDPEGRWLLEPCGIQTAHRTRDGLLYLSHLPTFGMEITGEAVGAVGTPMDLSARYNAPGDPASAFVNTTGLLSALSDWTKAGKDPWTVLSDEEASEARSRAEVPGFGVRQVLEAVGLSSSSTDADLATVIARLNQAPGDGGIPSDLFETIRLPNGLANSILDAPESEQESLKTLVQLLRQNDISSVLPLVTDAGVLLVVGVVSLPGVGVNIAERRSAGFRWYVMPISPSEKERKDNKTPVDVIGTTGNRTQLTPASSGLLAVVAVGYARRGLADPYQFQVQLPENAVLTLQQYEYLMNLLEHLHPLGIEVDTFAIRQSHVDINGDGNPEPLQTNVSKTYRQFQRSRYRGKDSTNLTQI
ncbi:hypothetical protein IQ273_18595 [Nodosilinea sp. LEGE 07298]|uniref:hypothetical protein n=1 Tax=Nodosilinea sp. LEGE 07298 TaxID=2777970 RepID=UPI001881223A|nr:hypothetical protein [Nodosilinea sp. LEGE 07298]MBE9111417.1 hypothetical protein [Nodosilinea sp. LEGE 07298]